MNYKAGLFYFPMSCDFFAQKEILYIKAHFGAKGLYIVQRILCEIYSKNGYFTRLTDDDCIILQEEWGCQISAGLIQEVIAESVKRGFFNKSIFDKFGILTSEGIQRDYIRSKQKSDVIYIKEEYWLLDNTNRKDVPASILKKITFITNDGGKKNNDGGKKNNDGGKIEQSKSNESKSNESKSNESKSNEWFELVWSAYPKRIKKQEAFEEFCSLDMSENLLSIIVNAINKQKSQEGWKTEGGKYIPSLVNWLKNRRWEDEINDKGYIIRKGTDSFNNFTQKIYSNEYIIERLRKKGQRLI